MRWWLISGLLSVVASSSSWTFSLQPTPASEQPAVLSFDQCIEADLIKIEELRNMLPDKISLQEINMKNNTSFGLLDEDWQRLYLLESRLPINSKLKTKLFKAFRLLISALYQAYGKTNDKEYNEPSTKSSLNYDSVLLKPAVNQSSNNKSDENYRNEEEEDNDAAESDLIESNVPPPKPKTYDKSGSTVTEDKITPGESYHNDNFPNNTDVERNNYSENYHNNGSLKEGNSALDAVDITTSIPATETTNEIATDSKQEAFNETYENRTGIGETVLPISDNETQTGEPKRGDLVPQSPAVYSDGKHSSSGRDGNITTTPISETNTETIAESKPTPLKVSPNSDTALDIDNTDNVIPTDSSDSVTEYDNLPLLPIDNSAEKLPQLTNFDRQSPEKEKITNSIVDSLPPYDTEMAPDEGIKPETIMISTEHSDKSVTPAVTSKQWPDSESDYDMNIFSSSNLPTGKNFSDSSKADYDKPEVSNVTGGHLNIIDAEMSSTTQIKSSSNNPQITTVSPSVTTFKSQKYTYNEDYPESKGFDVDIPTDTSLYDVPFEETTLNYSSSSDLQTANRENFDNESSSNNPETTTSVSITTFKLSKSTHNADSPESKADDIVIPSDSAYDDPFQITSSSTTAMPSETDDTAFYNSSTYKGGSTSRTYEPTTVSKITVSTHQDVDDNEIIPESKELSGKDVYTFPFTDYKTLTTAATVQPTKDAFKTFKIVFPKEKKNLVPVIPTNELKIYLPNRRPFRLGPFQPVSSFNCKNNNKCTRVNNVEFRDSEEKPPSAMKTLQENRRFSEYNKNTYMDYLDSDTGYWWYRMNNLRKEYISR